MGKNQIITLYSLLSNKPAKREEILYAGIGGAVNDSGVYSITKSTPLYELILKAKGLTERANIEGIDTNSKVIPFEVYCIPYLPKKEFKKRFSNKPIEIPELEAPQISVPKSGEQINIIYAGLPRTYLLISLFPGKNLVTITHIPWYTKATSDLEYPRTLYEIYLTGGVLFLARSIKRITRQTIKYYFAQDRPAWINFIDYLDGIEVNVPADIGKEYTKIFIIPSVHISLKENVLNDLSNHFLGTPFLIIHPDGKREFYFRINHEGHDLLHIHHDVFSFFAKADSIFYKFKSVCLPAEEKIFIYQCFQRHALNINIEQIFYPFTKEEMKEIFFAKKLRFSLLGNTSEFVSEIPSETREYWQEFYRKFN